MIRAGQLLCFLCALPALAQVTHPQPGLTYVKSADSALVVADLCAPGVSVRATEYGERQGTPATWAQKPGVDVEAAINADFFDFPGWTKVYGRARGGGLDWPVGKQFLEVRSYWQFGPGLAGLQPAGAVTPLAAPAVTEIVGGHNVLISGGLSQGPSFDGDSVVTTAHRRTAVGMSANRRFLYLFVSNLSLTGVGVVSEMTSLAAEAGAPPIDVATNMDGGGSSQMYVKGVGAVFATGREVNNHLGVRAKGTGPAPNCPAATCGNACAPDLKDRVALAASPTGFGYWISNAAGAISGAGNASLHGSLLGTPLNKPIVGMAATPSGLGYWLVASDGGIFTFGDAPFKGSLGGTALNAPIVGMAATPDGQGYWLVASDGGVFAFGTAAFKGSKGGTPLNAPIVGMARTDDGKGYWLVAADGGVFAFGNAVFYGSTGNLTLSHPIVGIAARPQGDGYWLVASDGGIFSFGAAAFYGSTGGSPPSSGVADLAVTPDGKGYWLLAKDGSIYSFGSAVYLGGAQSSLGCSGNTPLHCVMQPSGCFAWSNQAACTAGQTCRNGRCEAVCADACAAGESRCVNGHLETCGNFDSDTCLEFSAPGASCTVTPPPHDGGTVLPDGGVAPVETDGGASTEIDGGDGQVAPVDSESAGPGPAELNGETPAGDAASDAVAGCGCGAAGGMWSAGLVLLLGLARRKR